MSANVTHWSASVPDQTRPAFGVFRKSLHTLGMAVHLFLHRTRLLEALGSGALHPQHWMLVFELLADGLAQGLVPSPSDLSKLSQTAPAKARLRLCGMQWSPAAPNKTLEQMLAGFTLRELMQGGLFLRGHRIPLHTLCKAVASENALREQLLQVFAGKCELHAYSTVKRNADDRRWKIGGWDGS